MKWILLGALLAVLLLFPPLGTASLALVVAAVSQPLLVAFGLGLAAGAHLHRRRRTA